MLLQYGLDALADSFGGLDIRVSSPKRLGPSCLRPLDELESLLNLILGFEAQC